VAQYTFSFVRSEYDRIPIELKARLEAVLADSAADAETKRLVSEVCACVAGAIGDLSKYAQDQLVVR
jgi:hypothetical protein